MNLLFVCTGNTCRSPLAEFMMREAVKLRGLDITVRSAGISAAEGSPMSSGSREQLKRKYRTPEHLERTDQFIVEHEATLLDDSIVDWADVILTMTRAHADYLRAVYPEDADRIHSMWAVADPEHADYDVVDPFGGPRDLYERTYDELEQLIEKILDRL